MSSVFIGCSARILRRIWPLVFLFFSNWVYAISVTTSDVTILPDGTGQFTISWTGTSFNSALQESTNGGSSWSTVSSGYYDHGSVTLTRDPGIWWYRIEHCYFTPPSNLDCQYTGAYSFSVITPPDTPIISGPERNTTSPAIVLSCSWPSTATRFEWQQRLNGAPWPDDDDVFYTDTDPVQSYTVPHSGVWGYRVRACNDAGCSSYSSELVYNVAITPGVPGSISVPGNIYDGSFTVSWGAASGSVTKYDLDISRGSCGYSDEYDGLSRSKEVNVSESGTYRFQVRACNKVASFESCSGWRTSSDAVTSKPPVPVSLAVPGTSSNGEYSVSWNVITGVNKYTLQERTGDRDWTTVQDTVATSKNFSGKDNSRYSYQVRSCGDFGCSDYSSSKTINVVRERTGTATETLYHYDALGRLQFVNDTVNGNRDFDYDSAGNRTAVAEGVLSEDEDPIGDGPVPDPEPQFGAPTGLNLAGPFSQAGGYTASWGSVPYADNYVVGMEDGSQVETTSTSIGTAILRPLWVYAVRPCELSEKSCFAGSEQYCSSQ